MKKFVAILLLLLSISAGAQVKDTITRQSKNRVWSLNNKRLDFGSGVIKAPRNFVTAPSQTPAFADIICDPDSSKCYYYNGSQWVDMTGGGTVLISGVQMINNISLSSQYLRTGATGTNFHIVSTDSTHTFHIPYASVTDTGMVTIGAQSFKGQKTFTTGITVGSSGVAGIVGVARSSDGAVVGQLRTNSSTVIIDAVGGVGQLYYGGASVSGIWSQKGFGAGGASTPQVSLEAQGVDALKLAVGTTAQRPATPVDGYLRGNQDSTHRIEYYDGTSYKTLAYKNDLIGLGGGSFTLANEGSGQRLVNWPTQKVKSLGTNYAVIYDSATANTMKISVDSNLVTTRLWHQKAIDSIAALIGGGSGINNTNVGTGYDLLEELSQGMKRVQAVYGLVFDSATAHILKFRVDTINVATKDWVKKALDSTALSMTVDNALTPVSANHIEHGGAFTHNTDLTGNFTYNIGTSASKLAALGINTSGNILLNSSTGLITIAGGLQLNSTVEGDADQTLANTPTFVVLDDVTANRTLTMPSAATVGVVLIIWNKNTNGTFHWIFGGAGVHDAAGGSISTLTNTTFYQLISDGSNWIKMF